MTELTLTPSLARGGFAAQRRKSPSALAAAIALNGGVFALIIALPATQYLIPHPGDGIPVITIPIDHDPPKNQPEPKKTRPNPIQQTIPKPEPEKQTFVDPIVKTGGDTIIGGGGTGTLIDPGPSEVKPIDRPAHNPLFIKASQDPRYAGAFHPDYPPALRRAGLEGSATVRITIDESGKVIACELVKATDRAFFDETRSQALRYWRFKPATSDGAPVQSQQVLTVQFRLEEQ